MASLQFLQYFHEINDECNDSYHSESMSIKLPFEVRVRKGDEMFNKIRRKIEQELFGEPGYQTYLSKVPWCHVGLH